MWISMAMGLRNLRRRLGRTISTITMLVVGTTLIVFSIGMNEGPYDDMIKMGTGMWNGHVQVLHQEYQESPSLFKQVKAPNALIASLEKTPGVHAVTSRVEVAGLLSVGKRTAGVQMVGVDPVREPRVSTLPNTLKLSFSSTFKRNAFLRGVMTSATVIFLKVRAPVMATADNAPPPWAPQPP